MPLSCALVLCAVLCAGLLTLCGVRPALAESAAVQAQDGSTLVRLSRISVDPARLAACALTAGLAGTGLAGESLAKGTVMAAAPSTSAASSPSTVLFTPQVTAESNFFPWLGRVDKLGVALIWPDFRWGHGATVSSNGCRCASLYRHMAVCHCRILILSTHPSIAFSKFVNRQRNSYNMVENGFFPIQTC